MKKLIKETMVNRLSLAFLITYSCSLWSAPGGKTVPLGGVAAEGLSIAEKELQQQAANLAKEAAALEGKSAASLVGGAKAVTGTLKTVAGEVNAAKTVVEASTKAAIAGKASIVVPGVPLVAAEKAAPFQPVLKVSQPTYGAMGDEFYRADLTVLNNQGVPITVKIEFWVEGIEGNVMTVRNLNVPTNIPQNTIGYSQLREAVRMYGRMRDVEYIELYLSSRQANANGRAFVDKTGMRPRLIEVNPKEVAVPK